MDVVIADRPGLLAYHVELGDVVAAGDVLADLIILDGPTASRASSGPGWRGWFYSIAAVPEICSAGGYCRQGCWQ